VTGDPDRGRGKTPDPWDLDEIRQVREVVFVGEFFTLITTVALDETLRHPGEGDDEFAARLAGVVIEELYGFDVAAAAVEVGVVDPA